VHPGTQVLTLEPSNHHSFADVSMLAGPVVGPMSGLASSSVSPGAQLKAIAKKTIDFLREHMQLPVPAKPVAGQNGWTEAEVKGAMREIDGVTFRGFKTKHLPGAAPEGEGLQAALEGNAGSAAGGDD